MQDNVWETLKGSNPQHQTPRHVPNPPKRHFGGFRRSSHLGGALCTGGTLTVGSAGTGIAPVWFPAAGTGICPTSRRNYAWKLVCSSRIIHADNTQHNMKNIMMMMRDIILKIMDTFNVFTRHLSLDSFSRWSFFAQKIFDNELDTEERLRVYETHLT